MLKNRQISDVDPKQALIRALILGGLAFFGSLASVKIALPESTLYGILLAACIAFGIAFFTRLSVEYGLTQSGMI